MKTIGLAGSGSLIGGGTAILRAVQDPTTGEARAGRALVIGINETTNAPKLNCAVDDACLFVQWLTKKGGVKPENITLLTNPLLPTPPIAGVQLDAARNDTIIETIRESRIREVQTSGSFSISPDTVCAISPPVFRPEAPSTKKMQSCLAITNQAYERGSGSSGCSIT